MPVYLPTYLLPKNGNTFFLVEDTYLKGGYRVVPTTTARDAINALSRKPGMLVHCIDTGRTYRMNADKLSWTMEPLPGTGGTGSNKTYFHPQAVAAATWTVTHGQNLLHFCPAVFDNTGKLIIPQDLTVVNANTVSVSFSVPTNGYLVLMFHPT